MGFEPAVPVFGGYGVIYNTCATGWKTTEHVFNIKFGDKGHDILKSQMFVCGEHISSHKVHCVWIPRTGFEVNNSQT